MATVPCAPCVTAVTLTFVPSSGSLSFASTVSVVLPLSSRRENASGCATGGWLLTPMNIVTVAVPVSRPSLTVYVNVSDPW